MSAQSMNVVRDERFAHRVCVGEPIVIISFSGRRLSCISIEVSPPCRLSM